MSYTYEQLKKMLDEGAAFLTEGEVSDLEREADFQKRKEAIMEKLKAPPPPSVPEAKDYTCTCGDIFDTAQGLADHRAMIHDESPEAKEAPSGGEEERLDHETIAREFLKRNHASEYDKDSFSNRTVISMMAEGDKAYQHYYRLFHNAQETVNRLRTELSQANDKLNALAGELKTCMLGNRLAHRANDIRVEDLAAVTKDRDDLRAQVEFEKESHEITLSSEREKDAALDAAREELKAKELEAARLRGAWALLRKVYEAGADGERAISCCNGEHFDETLMRGDRLFRLSYADTDKFDAALSPVAEEEGGENG